MQVKIKGIKGVEPKRDNDKAIMELVSEPKQSPATAWFANEAVRKINMCRLYLQVESIADITNAEGTEICNWVFRCERRIDRNLDQEESMWPRQTKPGTRHILAWQTLLRTLTMSGGLKLHVTLGQWKIQPDPKRWEAMYHPKDDQIAIKTTNKLWSIAEIETKNRSMWKTGNTIRQVEYISGGEWVPITAIEQQGQQGFSPPKRSKSKESQSIKKGDNRVGNVHEEIRSIGKRATSGNQRHNVIRSKEE